MPTSFYNCDSCGATGGKMWRQYQCFSPWVFCWSCLKEDRKGAEQLKDEDIRPDGTTWSVFANEYTYEIAGLVPAIPCDEGWWGYSSVPDADIRAWEALPLYSEKKEHKLLSESMYCNPTASEIEDWKHRARKLENKLLSLMRVLGMVKPI